MTVHKRKRILFVIPSISSGGAERVVVHLFNHLSREIFDVHLAVLHMRDTIIGNFQENSAQFYDLEVKRTRNSPLALIKLIRKIEPDIIFSALPALNIVISLIKPLLHSHIKYIVRESSIPSKRSHKIPGLVYRYFYKHQIEKNNLIICQGIAMAEDLMKVYGVPKEKISIINNPIDYNRLDDQDLQVEHYNVLMVAGLRPHKGVDRLIKAAMLMDRNISIGIIGSGNQQAFLRELIEKNELHNINLLGFKSDPIYYMRNADVVVQTSHYEGFSNVLLESLATGTPVVAFDVPGGTSEIIDHGINGYLVENGDLEVFAIKTQEAISKEWDRANIRSRTYEKYNLYKIIREYEEAIDSVL